jgi:hypothetical protein
MRQEASDPWKRNDSGFVVGKCTIEVVGDWRGK